MSFEEQIKTLISAATRFHAGQKRKNGQDYVTHPIEVAASLGRDIVYYATAIFHDVLEDTTFTVEDIDDVLESIGFNLRQREATISAIQLLTKPKGFASDQIVFYTLAIKANHIAKEVKIADIKHNLSDLGEGNLKQKYLLQWYILMN